LTKEKANDHSLKIHFNFLHRKKKKKFWRRGGRRHFKKEGKGLF